MQKSETGISRRAFLKDTAKAAGTLLTVPTIATVLTAIDSTEARAQNQEIYTGPLEKLDGKPLITSERLSELLNALKNSGDPLMGKIATDISRLESDTTDSTELTGIVSKDALPMVITRDMSGQSLATMHTDGKETETGFLVTNTSQTEEWNFLKPALLGVNVGSVAEFEANDPLQEALMLAKESLNLMLDLRIYADYKEVLLPLDVNLLNPDGSIMTDKDLLDRAGFAIAHPQLAPDSDFSTILDILPVVMMAPSVANLAQQGKLPLGSSSMYDLYVATNEVLNDPRLFEIATTLNTEWARSQEMIGPDGFSSLLLQQEVIEGISRISGLLLRGNTQ